MAIIAPKLSGSPRVPAACRIPAAGGGCRSRFSRSTGPRAAAILIALVISVGQSAHAASSSWNATSNANWKDASSWDSNGVPGSTSSTTSLDTATFSLTQSGSRIVTVDTNRNIFGITFSTAGSTYAFGSTPNVGSILLTNGGYIQTAASSAANAYTINPSITIEGDGGGASFTGNATLTNCRLVFAGGITGVSTGSNVTTLTLNGTNTGSNAITGVIGDGSGGGKLAVTKSDAGTWVMASSSTYTGTTTLAAGVLRIGIATVGSVGAITSSAIGKGTLALNGGTLTTDASTARTILNSVTFGGDVTFGASSTYTGAFTFSAGADLGAATRSLTTVVATRFDGDMTNGGLTKAGSGTLTLGGANTYAGATTVSVGVLNIQNNTALGTTAAGTSVTSGAALEIQGGITVGAEALTLNGAGISSGGALRNITGDNDFGGLVTLGSASRINSDSGNLTLSNTATITGAYALTVGGAGNTTIASIIGTGTGTLTKDGAGTLNLGSTSTYSGGTTLSSGTLAVSANNALGTGNITFTSGTIQAVTNNVVLENNSTLQALTVSGTQNLTINGTMTGLTGNSRVLTNNIGAGNTLTIRGLDVNTESANSRSLTIAGTGNTTISGIIKNTGNAANSLIITNTGTTLFTAANTYVCPLTIGANNGGTAGTLKLSGAGTLGNGTVNVYGGTLDINGTSQSIGAINLGAGASGTSSTVLLGSGNLTLNANLVYASTNNANGAIISGDAGSQLVLGKDLVFTVNDSSAAAADLTISAVIANGGGTARILNFQGNGATVLTAANTYSGTTIIGNNGGFHNSIVKLSGSGQISTGPLTIYGGTLDLNGISQTVGTIFMGSSGTGFTGSSNINIGAGTLTMNGSLTYSSNGNNNGATITGGTINLNGARNFQVQDSANATTDLAISSVIADGNATSTVTHNSNGVLEFSGLNTYTGATSVTASGGVLAITNIGNATSANALGMSGNGSGNLKLSNGTTLRYTGAAASTDRLFTIYGTVAGDSATLDASGTGAVKYTNTGSLAYNTNNQARTLNLTGNNTGDNTLAALIANNGSGAVSVAKSGSGTWVLSGADTYSGGTTVNAGKLVVSGDQTGSGQIVLNNADSIIQFGDGTSTAGSAVNAGTVYVNSTGTVNLFKTNGGFFSNQIASNPSATITLSGTNISGTTNTFTGTQWSNGGTFTTLSTNAGAVLGFSGSGYAIDIKGTQLAVTGAGDTLFTGAIYNSTGTGNVLKSGTGTLIYQYANTYSGTTAIDAGAIRVDVAPSAGGTYYVGNGGTTGIAASLFLGGGSSGLTGGVTFDRAISANIGSGGDRVIGGTNTSGNNTYTGTVTLNDSNVTLQAATGGGVNFNTITASSVQTVAVGSAGNTGTVRLGGTADNLNTAVTVNYGTLQLNKTSSGSVHAVGNSAGTALTVNTGATAQITGTGGNQIYDASSATVNSGGVFDLNGQSETIAALNLSGTGISNGGALVNNNGATTSTLTATGGIALGANSTIGGSANIATSSVVSGGFSLTKSGGGTVVLTGNNTYTGPTNVTAGTLLVKGNQTAATGAVTVATGATLGGNGTIGGATTVQSGGTLAPGTGIIASGSASTPAVVTFTGNLTLETGSVFNFALSGNSSSGRGSNFSGVDVTGGNLTVQTGVNFNAIFNLAGSTTNFNDTFWDTSHSWLVFSNANIPSTPTGVFTLGTVSNDSFDNTFSTTGGTLSFSKIGNDLYLDFSLGAVPEPSTWIAMAALAFTGAAIFMRRPRWEDQGG